MGTLSPSCGVVVGTLIDIPKAIDNNESSVIPPDCHVSTKKGIITGLRGIDLVLIMSLCRLGR